MNNYPSLSLLPITFEMNKASLFDLLEPTPIDERSLAQLNALQAKVMALASSGWGYSQLSAAVPPTAPPSLLAQDEDLDAFCNDDYYKAFDDAVQTNDQAALHRRLMSDTTPRANDFLSQPWFQGLDSYQPAEPSKVASAGFNVAAAAVNPLIPQQAPQQSSMVRTNSMTSLCSFEPRGSDLDNVNYTPAMMSLLADSASIDAKRGRTPNISDSQSLRWTERYDELVEFKNKHGHCCIPSYWPSNTRLAQWVKRQRYQYKLRNEERQDRPSTLTEDRIKALEDLGFVWDSHAAFWEERWNELKEFRDNNGHTNVPTKYRENPQLGIWCKCQRRQYKIFRTEGPAKSYLTLGRIAKLMEIGFVFDPRANAKRRTKKSPAAPL